MAATAKSLGIGSAARDSLGASLGRSSFPARVRRDVRVRPEWSLGGVGRDRVFTGAAASALASHRQEAVADVVPAGDLASRMRSASVFDDRCC